jgi:glycosyltransferase involved in cell wall biosynthesis
MHKPTILQLLHGLSVGGAEVLAARLARRLADRYRFVFACLDHVGELGEALRDDGFPLVVLNRGSGFDWKCAARLRRELKAHGVDVIHAHQYTPFFYALAAGLFRRRPPVLFTEHGRFHPDFPRRKRIVFNRLFLRKKDRVVAVGEAVRQALIHNEGIPARRVQVIYNGIDIDRFEEPTEHDRAAKRQELGLEASAFVAVLVGRLDALKDHATAVRTAERVAAVMPNFRLLFVGDGPERAKIEAEIASRRLDRCITLLGTRHDVPGILHAADVGFLSSISEGIPLTLIEGMAAGLPVVSTDVGGVAEIVVDRATGRLAPAGDDQALAGCLLALADDPAERSRLGANGRDRAAELFSEQQMHRQYQELFDEMTGVPARPRSREHAVAASQRAAGI